MPDGKPSPIRRSTSPNPPPHMISAPASPRPSNSCPSDSLMDRPVSMISCQSGAPSSTQGPEGDERPEKARRKKAKAPHETLIFVRPPPTSKNYPMNFQCQLVAPGANRPRGSSDTSYHSINSRYSSYSTTSTTNDQFLSGQDSTETEQMESLAPPGQEGYGGTARPLSRSSSMKSTNSITSNGTAVSRNSGSANTKRIVPLYNLNYHTVLTTVITDAGTDAKVAKFLKRHVEITGVGVLEPYEQWPPLTPLTSFSAETSPASLRAPLPLPDPTSPRLSLDGVFARRGATAQDEQIGSEPKKLFGKLFGGGKKKDASATNGGNGTNEFSFFKSGGLGGSLFGSRSFISNTSSTEFTSKGAEGIPVSSSVQALDRRSSAGSGGHDGPRTQPYVGLPSLGTSPIVRPPTEKSSSTARPSAYVWIVTKWASAHDAWSFASLAESLSPNPPPFCTDSSGAAPSVRFEWIRGTVHSSRSNRPSRPEAPRRVSASGDARSASRQRQLHANALAVNSAGANSASNSPRESRTSLALPTKIDSPRTSLDVMRAEDEEEDQEDSEVPWHCWVKNSAGASCFLGTLSPAPYHPKVLAQLRSPYPIPPFALPGLKDKTSLSPEALKDVLTTTAIYLLVREEWGGIAKKGKKG